MNEKNDYREMRTLSAAELRNAEAEQCAVCHLPYCSRGVVTRHLPGCPLQPDIAGWNEPPTAENLRLLWSRLIRSNNFPEITGRICPAQCEVACYYGRGSRPLHIRDNELSIAEAAFAAGLVKPQPPARRSGKRVAVIGSGIAGLTVAELLNKRGHSIVVFERADRPGGLLLYGIPNMKLDKQVLRRRIELMQAEGVEFRCGVDAGRDITRDELERDFDVIAICTGATRKRELPVDVNGVSGAVTAQEYMRSAAQALLEDRLSDTDSYISACGRDVVIVGAGQCGSDCLAVALRQGAASVTLLDLQPQPDRERFNYALAESRERFGSDPRRWSRTVSGIECTADARLTAVNTVGLELRGSSLYPVEGSEESFPAQLLINATGFTGPELYVPQAFRLDVNEQGMIDCTGACSEYDTVFVAGEARRGPIPQIYALLDGRAAARSIDHRLCGFTEIR